jgi:uncharacterized protein
MSETPDAATLIRVLGLEPLGFEGGWFRETWRAREQVPTPRGPRAAGTAIYYLITPESFSTLHRLAFDEVFHFHLGDPVEMLLLGPGGAGEMVVLGSDVAVGQRPQVVVPAGTWQGARLVDGGRVALLGTTVAPGFDRADYEAGAHEALMAGWPAFADGIRALTR